MGDSYESKFTTHMYQKQYDVYQGWGWLTEFLVRLKFSVTVVNWLTDGGVCSQICLIFMLVSIFLSRIVDFLKICSLKRPYEYQRKIFFTDLMKLMCFKYILWNLHENTRIYTYEFKISNNRLTDHEYLQLPTLSTVSRLTG